MHVTMRMKLLCSQCKKLRFSQVFSSVVGRSQWPWAWLRGSSNSVGMDNRLKSSAQILWDYLRIDSPLKKSDLILVLGNSDLRTADYAANLYHEGFTPLLVVSGKEGHCTRGKWKQTEAVVFAERLMKNRVPAPSILLEPKATNTGENIRFTQRLLRDHTDHLQPQTITLIQTPFMGRRCLATFLKQWENAQQVDVMVSSPPIPLEEYPSREAGYGSLRELVVEMIRNMQRIEQYPRQGFQAYQYVPSHVSEAFRYLQSAVENETL